MSGGRRYRIWCLIACLSLFLMGCSSADADSVYRYASEAFGEASEEELNLLSEGKLGVDVGNQGLGSGLGSGYASGDIAGNVRGGLYGMLTAVCSTAKMYGPFIIIGSILIGIVMLRLAPKAIKVRRTAWTVFIIGIPVVMLLLIFGTAILADAFAS